MTMLRITHEFELKPSFGFNQSSFPEPQQLYCMAPLFKQFSVYIRGLEDDKARQNLTVAGISSLFLVQGKRKIKVSKTKDQFLVRSSIPLRAGGWNRTMAVKNVFD